METGAHSLDWQARTEFAPLSQHWAYGLTMERLGARVRRFVVDDHSVQTVERRGVRLIHQAPIGVDLAPLGRFPGVVLAVSLNRGRGCIPLLTERFNAVWQIDRSKGALLAAMRPTWRHALQHASADAIEDPSALQIILAAATRTMAARGVRGLLPSFAERWAGQSLVLRTGARPDAGAVFLIHGDCATYHAAWAGPQGRASGASRALLWKGAELLWNRGVRRIDLGAVDASNPGLAHFKLGTGAGLVSLGPLSLVLPL